MISIYEINSLSQDLKSLHKFFDESDTLGGVNNRHIPKLEQKFSTLTNKKTIAVNHCTNGLFIALQRFSPTVVLIPSIVFFGVIGAIVQAGHTPFFAPVDNTGNLDLTDVDFNKLPDDVIIMNVHMNSRVVDLRNSNHVVLEDAASAFGSSYADGVDLLSGTPHDAVISFSYGKPLTAGEGGMIFTRDNERWYRTKRYSGLDELQGDYGIGTFDVKDPGMKFPFNALGASLVTLQMRRFDDLLAQRRQASLVLDDLTKDFNCVRSYQLGNCLTYMMRFETEAKRDEARRILMGAGVQCYLNHKPAHTFSGMATYQKHEMTEESCSDYFSKVLHITSRKLSEEQQLTVESALKQIQESI